jgi:hypothetical protein
MNTLIKRSSSNVAKGVKKIVEITNPFSGKKIQNTNITNKEFLKEILENYFPGIHSENLHNFEDKPKPTKSKKS